MAEALFPNEGINLDREHEKEKKLSEDNKLSPELSSAIAFVDSRLPDLAIQMARLEEMKEKILSNPASTSEILRATRTEIASGINRNDYPKEEPERDIYVLPNYQPKEKTSENPANENLHLARRFAEIIVKIEGNISQIEEIMIGKSEEKAKEIFEYFQNNNYPNSEKSYYDYEQELRKIFDEIKTELPPFENIEIKKAA